MCFPSACVHRTQPLGSNIQRSPFYRGKRWYDWVMIDYGEKHCIHPRQIWCFLDLRTVHIWIDIDTEPGMYAVFELADLNTNKDELGMSDV